jgi:MFS family permease
MTPPRLIALLTVVEILAVLPTMGFPALVPQFSQAWGLTAGEAGWILGSMFISYMLAVPFLVPLTDRIDARLLVLAGTLLTGAANVGFALTAQGFWSACLWRFLAGIGVALFYMPGLRALTDRVPEASKPRAITVYIGSYSFGAGLSLALVGYLEAALDWQWAFILTGAGALAAFLLTLLLLAPKPPTAPAGMAPRHPLDFRAVFANRRALVYILAGGTHSFEFAIMRNWMTAFMAFVLAWHGFGSALGLGAADIAALTTLTVLPASMVGGELARRFGQRNLIVGVMVLSFAVACTGGLAAATSVWFAVAFVFAHTFTVALDQGALGGGAIAAARPGEVGQVMTLLTTCNWLGVAAGPIAAGLVFDLLGGPTQPAVWGWGYALAGFVPLLGGAMLLFLLPREPAGTAP